MLLWAGAENNPLALLCPAAALLLEADTEGASTREDLCQ